MSENRAKEIFLVCIQKDTPQDRADYVIQACAGDSELRDRVENLLEAYEENSDKFLEQPAASLTVGGVNEVSAEEIGTWIGPYKIREQIGEGGMGIVYVAEQEKPIRRKVALKIIKPGMDTKQVISRFEAERQVLSLMNHPNVAKVLDAGVTEKGRPFFVMELVQGLPVTEYCHKKKLTTRERLELFIQICRAVQHAHQKGIIHRDLKPSNVLVAEIDGVAVPKVIDFGVAKAVGEKLLEQTTDAIVSCLPSR